MKIEEREKSRILRKRGYSINQIVRDTGFAKGSVSIWVRDITLTKKQMDMISANGRSMESVEKRRMSRLKNEYSKKRLIIEAAKKDYSAISTKELKLIGIILYLGEGLKTNKGTVSVANSDPEVIKIMMRFFREICNVPEDKFRGQIHTFEKASISDIETYWSNITKIPTTQFYKTYTKQSSSSLKKRKTLPYGTFDLSINNTKLLLTILGWIEKIKELALKV